LNKYVMNKQGLLVILSLLLLAGCSKEQGLSDKDRAYYHDALSAGLRPTVVIMTENAVAEQLFGSAQANAAMVGRIQAAYAANIHASANQIGCLDASGVNPEIVAMAGDMKIARLKQLEVIPNIREPDMGGAATEFLAKLIFNQLSARDSQDSDARMSLIILKVSRPTEDLSRPYSKGQPLAWKRLGVKILPSCRPRSKYSGKSCRNKKPGAHASEKAWTVKPCTEASSANRPILATLSRLARWYR
jgi:hypothetical protein